MIVDLARPQDHEAAPRDAAKQLQQPPIAGTVDACRPRDHDLDPGIGRGLPRDRLPFHLRLLVDVTGPERGVFVRRWLLDIAVHADGTAMHDPPRAAGRAASITASHRRRVDGPIPLVGQTRLTVDRGDVIDDVDTWRGARASDGRRAGRRARFDPPRTQVARRARRRAPAPAPDTRARASPRARCPPVNPVAPVTRTRNVPPRPSPAIRAACAAPSPRASLRCRRVIDWRSDPFVQRDRQHELPVTFADAEAVGGRARARSHDR